MQFTLRIAILECDEPVGQTRQKYHNFGNLFKQLLEAGAKKVGETTSYEEPALEISRYDIVGHMTYPNLGSVDAVLLTGSRYDSFSEEHGWIARLVRFTRSLLYEQTRVRVMGVCFGHQIIARALGVMPTRNDKGWEVAVVPLTLVEKGKEVFGVDSLAIHEMHRDAVPRLPPDVQSVGYSSRCDVQGMYRKDRLLSVQGHPEFNEKIVNELLDLRRGVVLDDETYHDGKRRAHDKHDGEAVAAGFVNFLLEG